MEPHNFAVLSDAAASTCANGAFESPRRKPPR
jgi:hypothetical protein